MSSLSESHRSQLASALAVPRPYFGEGIQTFDHDSLTLWRVSLARFGMNADQLNSLAAACLPATFGRNQEDVLDEAYRKAGKLDKADFALNLDLVGSGLLGRVHDALFGWESTPRGIRAELYKHMVCPGSFFKAHKDTPRGHGMFGSLVLNFPMPHQGGALALRHEGHENIHDPSKAIYTADNQVSWVAFFSDVEHEVLPVTTGHRVTITYNLYYHSVASTVGKVDNEPLKNVWTTLLEDRTFLPQGG
ncbi:hypothetical protein BKA62DRAFT_741063 [Auriculariales sp. MPI-PUGE-AT-0066]|nr:hypothetical protein BKA62DRAFT_741063 [Auriculariales sp. MPI-PUGE-AT-0066]